MDEGAALPSAAGQCSDFIPSRDPDGTTGMEFGSSAMVVGESGPLGTTGAFGRFATIAGCLENVDIAGVSDNDRAVGESTGPLVTPGVCPAPAHDPAGGCFAPVGDSSFYESAAARTVVVNEEAYHEETGPELSVIEKVDGLTTTLDEKQCEARTEENGSRFPADVE